MTSGTILALDICLSLLFSFFKLPRVPSGLWGTVKGAATSGERHTWHMHGFVMICVGMQVFANQPVAGIGSCTYYACIIIHSAFSVFWRCPSIRVLLPRAGVLRRCWPGIPAEFRSVRVAMCAALFTANTPYVERTLCSPTAFVVFTGRRPPR